VKEDVETPVYDEQLSTCRRPIERVKSSKPTRTHGHDGTRLDGHRGPGLGSRPRSSYLALCGRRSRANPALAGDVHKAYDSSAGRRSAAAFMVSAAYRRNARGLARPGKNHGRSGGRFRDSASGVDEKRHFRNGPDENETGNPYAAHARGTGYARVRYATGGPRRSRTVEKTTKGKGKEKTGQEKKINRCARTAANDRSTNHRLSSVRYSVFAFTRTTPSAKTGDDDDEDESAVVRR